MDGIISKIDNAIKWSFYIIFFFVPLIIWPDTFELFEFNKMWLVFGFSVIIFFLWGTKVAMTGKFELRRTPLDIPIALFLLSQIISTIFSIDPHVSLWGYYSRFNGGLLSTIAYIFLYYAFASNLIPTTSDPKKSKISGQLLIVILLSGLAVTLWGLPSHFGADPTCLVFRGTLDTACWTDQFQPTVRIFSTLGQPNWMGAFMAALIPLSLGVAAYKFVQNRNKLQPILYLILSFLFFLALIYTRSQSSYMGLLIGLGVFFAIIIVKNLNHFREERLKDRTFRFVLTAIIAFAAFTLIVGTPSGFVNRYITIGGLASMIAQPTQQTTPVEKPKETGLENNTTIQLTGGTESSKIRLIVWQGALELFKQNPLFGTGVETYAYAYYGVKPLAHNLTSEWDYLYNKAHNEYLNYLATTGLFGLLTYISIIGLFFFKAFIIIKNQDERENLIGIGIIGGYVAILVSNFFGFSVVPINLLFFTFPILFFAVVEPSTLKTIFSFGKGSYEKDGAVGMGGMATIVVLIIIALFFEFKLINFWFADKQYALGNNLNKAGQPTQAYQPLVNAVQMMPSEDLYKDELSINMATLALILNENKDATRAAMFAQQAKQLSDSVVAAHPKNVVFRKTNIRVDYALAQIDPKYLDEAIAQVQESRKLAPTDAKLLYNLGLFYSQKGDSQAMMDAMKEAIRLKPNYVEPHYAIALEYTQLAKNEPAKASEYNASAASTLNYILKNLDPNYTPAKELLKSL